MSPTIYVLGNVNVDLVMGPLALWPNPGTELVLAQTEMRAGGAAGNTALALKAMGARYRLICNMGDDILGRWLGEELGERDWPKAAMPTSISVGLTHPNGERTFLTSKGHLEAMTLEIALDQLPARATPGDVVLLAGPFLSPHLLGSYDALIAELAKLGFALALDTGWPIEGWTAEARKQVTGWLKFCDHVLLNEIESCGLAEETEVEAAAAWLRRQTKPGATVIVKRGPFGASAWRGDQHAEAAAPKIAVVDTIGAGDVFNAAYLRTTLAGGDLSAAVAAGVAAASLAISTSPRRYK
jgi:sugar/nucleoside kinase (ribokinase family)